VKRKKEVKLVKQAHMDELVSSNFLFLQWKFLEFLFYKDEVEIKNAGESIT
jgi:hypothetical protein